jgi:hypothetical protein
VLFHRGHAAAAAATSHRPHGWLVVPLGRRVEVRVRRDAEAPPRGRDPPWFTTLRGALAAMAGSAFFSLATSLCWLLWSQRFTFPPLAEEGTLTLGLAVLFGSLVNLVAVVSGCWSAVLGRRG